MTSASQFSLEEENFYKDIQDLVKKGSQNEKQLSTFLQRYMDLLARADIDDEALIINFTKAALILEASTKVYGTKVDRLWVSLEQMLESLKVNGKSPPNKKKGENDEEVEEAEGEAPADDAEPLKKLPNPRRRRRVGDGLSSPDDFLEIDNISGLLGKNMNEDERSRDVKIKFHEEIPNLFIKNKTDRRRIDVCLVQSTDDRDDSRLRDWIISAENMLVKDMYLAPNLDGSNISVTVRDGDLPIIREEVFDEDSVFNTVNDVPGTDVPDEENVPDIGPAEPVESVAPVESEESQESQEPVAPVEHAESMEPEEPVAPVEPAESAESMESEEPDRAASPVPSADTVRPFESSSKGRGDGNNNARPPVDPDARRRSLEQYLIEKRVSKEYREKIMEAINRSQEVDVGKFPNVFLNRIDDFLIDINEVFWNSARFEDIIPTRKMRVKKTNKIPCQLCTQRASHTKKSKRCQANTKNPPLDEYFSPLAQPAVTESPFGILPDEELHDAYKVESKLVERLSKLDTEKNIYEAYHPESLDEESQGFNGFEGVENPLMRNEPSSGEDNEAMESNDGPDQDEVAGIIAEPPEIEEDTQMLPMPTTESSVPATESSSADVCSLSSDQILENSRMEYQEIITGELKKQEAAKSQFEKSKEAGLRIANWHASLAKKIEESQNRGPFNVDQLAGKIMESFPSTSSCEKPEMSFQSLVEGQSRRDIPRYFFSCLQLANEGNIDIFKSSNEPLATDCMMVKQLRPTRVRHELDEYSNNTSPKKVDKDKPQSSSSSSNTPKRKRNSDSSSSTDSSTGASQRKVIKPSSSKAEEKASRKRRLSLENKSKKKRKEQEDSE